MKRSNRFGDPDNTPNSDAAQATNDNDITEIIINENAPPEVVFLQKINIQTQQIISLAKEATITSEDQPIKKQKLKLAVAEFHTSIEDIDEGNSLLFYALASVRALADSHPEACSLIKECEDELASMPKHPPFRGGYEDEEFAESTADSNIDYEKLHVLIDNIIVAAKEHDGVKLAGMLETLVAEFPQVPEDSETSKGKEFAEKLRKLKEESPEIMRFILKTLAINEVIQVSKLLVETRAIEEQLRTLAKIGNENDLKQMLFNTYKRLNEMSKTAEAINFENELLIEEGTLVPEAVTLLSEIKNKNQEEIIFTREYADAARLLIESRHAVKRIVESKLNQDSDDFLALEREMESFPASVGNNTSSSSHNRSYYGESFDVNDRLGQKRKVQTGVVIGTVEKSRSATISEVGDLNPTAFVKKFIKEPVSPKDQDFCASWTSDEIQVIISRVYLKEYGANEVADMERMMDFLFAKSDAYVAAEKAMQEAAIKQAEEEKTRETLIKEIDEEDALLEAALRLSLEAQQITVSMKLSAEEVDDTESEIVRDYVQEGRFFIQYYEEDNNSVPDTEARSPHPLIAQFEGDDNEESEEESEEVLAERRKQKGKGKEVPVEAYFADKSPSPTAYVAEVQTTQWRMPNQPRPLSESVMGNIENLEQLNEEAVKIMQEADKARIGSYFN